MKKLKGKFAFALFILSWIVLYWLTRAQTPWQNTVGTGGSGNEICIDLGDIPRQNYDSMGFTKAVVRYAEGENGWIVGTERGELFLFSNEGKQIWKHSLGIGKLISVCLSRDGKVAYVGEQSPSGNLYAVDVHSGDILWQHAAADFIGSDASQRSNPSVVHISVDGNNHVYANIYRFLMQKDGLRGYSARMIAVSETGEILWKFPSAENMDSWINWCDVNDENGSVVLSTSAYEYQADRKYNDTMYFIDKNTGVLLNSAAISPIPPFDSTVMRGSPNFSRSGKYLAAASSDGRAFLLDPTGHVLWQRTLSRPTMVDGAWINASGRDGFALPEGIVFTTINTFNRENWQLPTPVEHPGNNSLFFFRYDGTFVYQFMSKGTMEEIAFADGKIACAVGRNVRTHDYSAHGALLLNIEDGSIAGFFHTEGPLQSVGISQDAVHMAGVEAPAVTPDGRIIGAYRLHIWTL